MIFHAQQITGVYAIEPQPYADERGMLRRHFCQREFSRKGLAIDIRQSNISENKKRHTLRGFHYQLPPHGEDKVLSCIQGSIYNIVLDLREDSDTYLTWLSYQLSAKNRLSLFVPKGCANAYLTLEDNTWILYYHSEFYTPCAEAAIRFNDPFFNFKWPFEPLVISEKDRNHPDFKPPFKR
jgi:dTDP-4-dehydrorhamnose 3,5-epimerase